MKNYSTSCLGSIQTTKKPGVISLIKRVGQDLCKVVTLDVLWQYIADTLLRNSEPKVCQRRDRYGNTFWHVYDPVTHRSSDFGSGADVLVWLEKRYYK